MRVLIWITEGGWEACVDAAAILDADAVTLLHVAGVELPGPRGRRYEQVLAKMGAFAGEAAQALLDDAEERLGRSATKLAESGQAETIVLEAARDADLLIVARDGRRIGPHSFGHELRFVVDHAPCTVVLTWPEGAPEDRDAPPPKPKPKPKGKPKPKPPPPPA
jgi:nucleotide-binding universal stress UspA family protein